jgi:RNA polymerase sigma-70 factor (ECF subfamily)
MAPELDSREGWRRSLDDFAHETRPRLWGLLRRHGVPDRDVEDLVQQILLALVRCWDRVREPEAWVAGAAHKASLMYFRTRGRRIWSTVDDVSLEWLAVPEAPCQEDRLLSRELAAHTAGLPEHYRAVLRLRFGLGYEPREVAHRLGYRRSSIGKVTARGVEALRRAVSP